MNALKFIKLQIFCATFVSATFDIILILPNTSVKSVAELPQGYLHQGAEVKTAYKLHANRLTWSKAKEACVLEGARLAVIDNPEKLEKIRNLRKSRKLIWTGIRREAGTPNWESVDGDSISPNTPRINFFPFTYGDCVAVIGSDSTTRLIAQPCEFPRGYICEIPDVE